MADAGKAHRKLLFVVSNDFGELSSAISFSLGQEFVATMALPPRLFAIHGEHLPFSACCYRTVTDVLKIVDRERPDVVMLFSGYLFGVNGLFSADELDVLIKTLRNRQCRLVTTDPFLGLMANPGGAMVHVKDGNPKTDWLVHHFSTVANLMQGMTHLYSGNVATTARQQIECFFNEHIIHATTQSVECDVKPNHPIATDAGKKRWMFVLSHEDYGVQIELHGRQNFDALLLRRMEETLRAGRQPILVGPKTCVDAMTEQAEITRSAILLPFCDYNTFQALLLGAEYLFYWNAFSHSILCRVANGLPVIVFDKGHVAHAIRLLYQAGLQAYYGKAEVPFHSQSIVLDPLQLAELAAAQRQPMADQIARLRTLPSPAQVIARIARS